MRRVCRGTVHHMSGGELKEFLKDLGVLTHPTEKSCPKQSSKQKADVSMDFDLE